MDRAPVSLEVVAGGRRAFFYSINAMRLQHPAWFTEDLKRLFALLASGTIQPRVAERIALDEVAEAHRRLEAGGLEGSLCCARISRRDATSVPSDNGARCRSWRRLLTAGHVKKAATLNFPLGSIATGLSQRQVGQYRRKRKRDRLHADAAIGVSYRKERTRTSADYRPPVRNRVEIRRMTHRVFVYGTLKKGFWNNPLLKDASSSVVPLRCRPTA